MNYVSKRHRLVVRDGEAGAAELRRMAEAFAANPPAQVTFVPVTAKLIEAISKGAEDYTSDGVVFDTMRRGDPCVIRHRTTIYYAPSEKKEPTQYDCWIVCRCTSRGDKQRFDNGHGIITLDRHCHAIFRVPYVWRAAVAKLVGMSFDTREELEAAINMINFEVKNAVQG